MNGKLNVLDLDLLLIFNFQKTSYTLQNLNDNMDNTGKGKTPDKNDSTDAYAFTAR